MQPKDSRLRFYEARRIFGKSIIHQVALAFAILFVVSVVGNLVALHNFEVARRGHVLQVQNWLFRLHHELYSTANHGDFTYDTARQARYTQARGVIEGLDTAVWSLANHHNFRYGAPTARFTSLGPALHNTLMIANDPTINAQVLTGIIYALIEELQLTEAIRDSHMPTQVLFDAMHEAFREIERKFGKSGRVMW